MVDNDVTTKLKCTLFQDVCVSCSFCFIPILQCHRALTKFRG